MARTALGSWAPTAAAEDEWLRAGLLREEIEGNRAARRFDVGHHRFHLHGR
jgi:hypothetical protein